MPCLGSDDEIPENRDELMFQQWSVMTMTTRGLALSLSGEQLDAYSWCISRQGAPARAVASVTEFRQLNAKQADDGWRIFDQVCQRVPVQYRQESL